MVEVERVGGIPPYPVQHVLTSDIRKEAARQGNQELISMWAGQASALARKQSAFELVEGLVQGFKKAVDNVPKELKQVKRLKP
jgi:nitronate monooxygenase